MKYKRIVVKIGTNLVNHDDNSLNTKFLKKIVAQIASLHKKGYEIILVSSGAVASGRKDIIIKKETRNIPYRQALAAVGQSTLMHIYYDLFGAKNIKIAQALLTNNDFINRKSYITTRNIFELLFSMKVVSIVNENDVTTYDELKFGDNDMLSAKTAAMVNADLLVILTDVSCVYDKDPKKYGDAKCIRVIEKIDSKIKKQAGKATSKKSLGGMETKIQAAEFATQSGIEVLIAGGNQENVLEKIISEEKNVGTLIKTSRSKSENRKIWIKSKLKKGAEIVVDDGAKKAILEKGSSLLPIGVKKVKGIFGRGDVVKITDLEGNVIGAGQTNYRSTSLDKIKGNHSKDIRNILVAIMEEEVVHRDNMVVF